MAGQGRHCGPVTTRVEALVRALSAAVLLDSGPLLPCPCWVLPTSVAEQGTSWGWGGNASTDVLSVGGGAQVSLGLWKKGKACLGSWIRT